MKKTLFIMILAVIFFAPLSQASEWWEGNKGYITQEKVEKDVYTFNSFSGALWTKALTLDTLQWDLPNDLIVDFDSLDDVILRFGGKRYAVYPAKLRFLWWDFIVFRTKEVK